MSDVQPTLPSSVVVEAAVMIDSAIDLLVQVVDVGGLIAEQGIVVHRADPELAVELRNLATALDVQFEGAPVGSLLRAALLIGGE